MGELSPVEREALIASVISSEALSGLALSRDLVEEALERVLAEPLVDLG